MNWKKFIFNAVFFAYFTKSHFRLPLRLCKKGNKKHHFFLKFFNKYSFIVLFIQLKITFKS